MDPRRRAPLSTPPPSTPRGLLYTAQDVARFCEVDLKTIHNWADGGKIPHHRTAGRHLRFRHVHVVAFLRRHGYPVHAELASARPSAFLAGGPTLDGAALESCARRLSARFSVRRFASAVEALAHVIAGQPDAVILSAADPTWGGPRAVSALKGNVETAWPALVVLTDEPSSSLAEPLAAAGTDLVLGAADVGRLGPELARLLGVD